MKKEIVITILCCISLVLVLCTAVGCKGSYDKYSGGYINLENAEESRLISKFNGMEIRNSCLACVGCVEMSSPTNCCGNSESYYYGCADCFGVTTSDDTKPADIVMTCNICNGLYCVNIPVQDKSGDLVPIYGCMSTNK